MKEVLFIIVQCTWGILQTLAGAVVFMVRIDCPHTMYRCAVDTRWDRPEGLSLGLFIFTPQDRPGVPQRASDPQRAINPDSAQNATISVAAQKVRSANAQKIRVHEYGHCMQSLVLGPLYVIIGIISFFWNHFPYFVELREKKHLPYTACFVEAWASKWGELVTGEKAIWY